MTLIHRYQIQNRILWQSHFLILPEKKGKKNFKIGKKVTRDLKSHAKKFNLALGQRHRLIILANCVTSFYKIKILMTPV